MGRSQKYSELQSLRGDLGIHEHISRFIFTKKVVSTEGLSGTQDLGSSRNVHRGREQACHLLMVRTSCPYYLYLFPLPHASIPSNVFQHVPLIHVVSLVADAASRSQFWYDRNHRVEHRPAQDPDLFALVLPLSMRDLYASIL